MASACEQWGQRSDGSAYHPAARHGRMSMITLSRAIVACWQDDAPQRSVAVMVSKPVEPAVKHEVLISWRAR
jgi:hypothetical protein